MRAFFRPLLTACLVLSLSANICAQQTASRLQPVGMTALHYEDSQRRNWENTGNRPLNVTLWYPAVADAKETPWELAIFNAGRNARDAVMKASPQKMPLLLLSHGTGGSAASMAWLAESLAANNYLVAAVSHHGNTDAEPNPMLQGTLVWWDRPRDLSVLIDKLLADPDVGPRIDPTRIGVAGFSMGGYTALASVGARLSRNQWMEFCAGAVGTGACKLPPEVSAKFSPEDVQRLMTQDQPMLEALSHMDEAYADSRIKAAFAIAPVIKAAMTQDSLKSIKVPLQIVVGSDDDQAAPSDNAKLIAALVPGAKLQILPKVTHYTFLPSCNERGNTYVKELCLNPAGVDRNLVHQQVSDKALRFFSHTLKY